MREWFQVTQNVSVRTSEALMASVFGPPLGLTGASWWSMRPGHRAASAVLVGFNGFCVGFLKGVGWLCDGFPWNLIVF